MSLEKWNFDTIHSSVNFMVRHLLVSKVRGQFASWKGTLELDEAEPANSKLDVTIDVASVDTRQEQRDAHLRSGDFFLAEQFPHITFHSTRVSRAGEGYSVDGDLTIRGVTRPVTLAVESGGRVKDAQMGERIGFSAHTTIDRRDYGVTWNKTLDQGGLALSDKIAIEIEIEATK